MQVFGITKHMNYCLYIIKIKTEFTIKYIPINVGENNKKSFCLKPSIYPSYIK